MATKLEKVKKLCKPLTKQKNVVAVWARNITKKGAVEVIVLIDDTKKFLPLNIINAINKVITAIEKRAVRQKLKLKFRPVKRLTLWWDMIRQGEPGAVALLSDAVMLLDKTGVGEMMANLVKERAVYSIEEKADMLLARAKTNLEQAKEILLKKASTEVFFAMTESAQAVFMYAGIRPPSPKEMVNEMREAFVATRLLKGSVLSVYEDMEKAISRNAMLSGKKLEDFTVKAKKFMFEMEELILKLEREKNSAELEEAYSEAMRLCTKAMYKETKEVPQSQEERIMLFKNLFVDTKKINPVHFRTLKELYVYNKAKGRERSKISDERYLDRVYVNGLKMAVTELIP